jgi:DNA-binding PadR family transcriptional regulator
MPGIPNISEKEYIILKLLLPKRRKLYGLELVNQSKGTLKRGTVYVTLDRMEDKGFIRSFLTQTPKGEQGPSRRKYEITGLGQKALASRELLTSYMMTNLA